MKKKFSAKEMMDAKKDKKKAKQEEREVKKAASVRNIDRNDKAKIEDARRKYVLSMKNGKKQSLDEILTESIKNLMHYQALVYENDRISMTVFEKLIRAMRVVACIYADNDLSDTTNEAQAAIEQLSESDDLSPNQRREILKPVLRLIDKAGEYDKKVPSKTVDKIGRYCASVQIAVYTASLYTRPKRYIQALFDIINGQSLRTIAKKINEKETVLREEVLNAAWHFFRVAECNNAVQPVSSIPELRQDGYKVLADFERLKDFIQTAMQKILIPFEQNTGISLINYNQFRKDLVQAEII